MNPVTLILLVGALLAGAVEIVESRGRSLAGWGVLLIALFLILKFVAP